MKIDEGALEDALDEIVSRIEEREPLGYAEEWVDDEDTLTVATPKLALVVHYTSGRAWVLTRDEKPKRFPETGGGERLFYLCGVLLSDLHFKSNGNVVGYGAWRALAHYLSEVESCDCE